LWLKFVPPPRLAADSFPTRLSLQTPTIVFVRREVRLFWFAAYRRNCQTLLLLASIFMPICSHFPRSQRPRPGTPPPPHSQFFNIGIGGFPGYSTSLSLSLFSFGDLWLFSAPGIGQNLRRVKPFPSLLLMLVFSGPLHPPAPSLELSAGLFLPLFAYPWRDFLNALRALASSPALEAKMFYLDPPLVTGFLQPDKNLFWNC